MKFIGGRAECARFGMYFLGNHSHFQMQPHLPQAGIDFIVLLPNYCIFRHVLFLRAHVKLGKQTIPDGLIEGIYEDK